MKVKTSDLTDRALDLFVAKALGHQTECRTSESGKVRIWLQISGPHWCPVPCYSTDWVQGGPIIDREKLDVAYLSRQAEWYCYRRNRSVDDHVINAGFGPTALIAAMRCFVASKLGDEVEIPEELL